jgi:short-subunit dehydrogenase
MTPKQKPLNEQVIVITGASSGIGLATARAAAVKGARVVLAARSTDTMEGIAEELRRAGGEAEVVTVDVADRKGMERLADAAATRFGGIDTWVNNAGLAIYGRLDEVPEEDSRRLFDVNFWGVVNGSLAALPHLKRSRGTLINIGSEASEEALPMLGMYAATKHAVKGFTDSLRVEVQMDTVPVQVTLIQPSAVNTPFPQHARNYTGLEPSLPDPTIEPDQVAEAILDAACNPRRDVKVGTMAHVNTMMNKLAPKLADKMAGREAESLVKNQSAQDPAGTLYRPGEAGVSRGEKTKPEEKT